MIDIDNLKAVNDTKGHDEGDNYIANSVKAIKSSLREADLISRWGGDEFVCAVELPKNNIDIAENPEMEKVINRLLNTAKILNVSFSIGIARYDKGEKLENVIKAADRRMYSDKFRNPK